MNKTPFEIRLDVLKMAKEILEYDYFTQKEMLLNVWQLQAATAQEHGYPIPNGPVVPAYPSTSDIIKKAKELNVFISNA